MTAEPAVRWQPQPQPQPLVRVAGLRVHFDRVRAVDGIDFEIRAGEGLALVGESGSGKTVASRTLLGLVPKAGRIAADTLEIAGEDARRFDDARWQRVRGRTVGLVAQDALVSLDPLRTVGREVAEVVEIQSRREGRKVSGRGLTDMVQRELTRVAIPQPDQRARQYAHELSGGLRQRALIAAATIARPEILIADEPTTALDVSVQAQILDLLGDLKRDGMALLVISHDLALVARIADRVAVMRSGRIVETGPVADVLGNPQHEYTRTLLAAAPSLHERRTRLSVVSPTEPVEPTAAAAVEPVLPAPADAAADARPVVVSVRNVSQRFRQPDGRDLQAVDDVSFDLHAGQTIGLVGESGSGKTTLGRIILGLQPPDAGEVLLNGRPWSAVSEGRRRPDRHVIQAVYQDPLSSFDPRLTVGAILDQSLALTGVPRSARQVRAVELSAQVGLESDLLARRPRTLSGGQRQRVAIARALAREPRVLVCDEPVSALDVSIQAQVLDLFADIRDRLGLAMLFISHDLGVIHHVSDEVLVMKDGRIVERGPSDTVFLAPQHPYTRALLAALPSAASSTQGAVG
jgi:peptide/nickel transport system ATP-binding protein